MSPVGIAGVVVLYGPALNVSCTGIDGGAACNFKEIEGFRINNRGSSVWGSRSARTQYHGVASATMMRRPVVTEEPFRNSRGNQPLGSAPKLMSFSRYPNRSSTFSFLQEHPALAGSRECSSPSSGSGGPKLAPARSRDRPIGASRRSGRKGNMIPEREPDENGR